MRNGFSTLLYFLLAFLPAYAQTYAITDFGAKADTGFLNTNAIQAAIDQCYGRGGGEVMIPAGTYYTGTVFLKSNVYLHLTAGAVLQGSYRPADYPEYDISSARKYGTITHNGLYVKYLKALVIAHDATNTGITGQGTIKGAGEGAAFQLGLNKDGKPINLLFIGCKDLLLRDIRVLNAAQVTISISGCERVRVDGLFVRSLVNWNCDGIDVDARDAAISNCIIDSEDDALCFKSEYLNKFCENISVTNCTIASICNGIKFGTGSRSGFRNVTIDNCVIKKGSFNGYRHFTMTPDVVFQPDSNSVNSGIVIAGVDGGIVENINISNIVMTDVLTPFMIRIGRRFVNPEGKPAVMRHIRIQNVIAESRSIMPSLIAGLQDSPVEDVQLSNIRITVPIGIAADSFKAFPSVIPEAEKSYPENRMFGTRLPGSGFYMRHAKGIVLQEVSIYYKEADARPAIYLDDVSGLKLKAVLIDDKKLKATAAMLVQKGSNGIEITE